MDRNGTERRRAPATIELPRERFRLVQPPHADFLSQLIAERQAPVGEAVSAYDRGARIAIRRMPAGYRTTIVT